VGESLPPELARLLAAADEAAREPAWEVFVATYSRLLLHTVRSVARGYDPAMDSYVHVLDALRQDDFRRLRAYTPVPRVKFTTWLVVVARRLCLDLERHKYGRAQGSDPQRRGERAARRRLVDLVGADLDPTWLADAADVAGAEPERREVAEALAAALAALESRELLGLQRRRPARRRHAPRTGAAGEGEGEVMRLRSSIERQNGGGKSVVSIIGLDGASPTNW
jgi:DNA-directed RNA polymerase specialized sigma24 family protein